MKLALRMRVCAAATLALLAATAVSANPKKFSPSPPEGSSNGGGGGAILAAPAGSNSSDKEARFGFAFPGTMQNGLNGNGNSVYPGYGGGQINLDLGGLILGAVVGLGAVFVLPKLLHVFTNSHEHYRSLAELGAAQQVARALSKVDAALAENKIESGACAQRALCSYAQDASRAVAGGRAGALDSMLDFITSDSVLGGVLQGSPLMKAVDLGRAGAGCAHVFAGCPVSGDKLMATAKTLMASLLPAE